MDVFIHEIGTDSIGWIKDLVQGDRLYKENRNFTGNKLHSKFGNLMLGITELVEVKKKKLRCFCRWNDWLHSVGQRDTTRGGQIKHLSNFYC